MPGFSYGTTLGATVRISAETTLHIPITAENCVQVSICLQSILPESTFESQFTKRRNANSEIQPAGCFYVSRENRQDDFGWCSESTSILPFSCVRPLQSHKVSPHIDSRPHSKRFRRMVLFRYGIFWYLFCLR